MKLETLFFKSYISFAKEYDLNVEYIKDILCSLISERGLSTSVMVGITELQLLKQLDLFDEIDTEEDPRNLVYIIYSNI